MPIIKSNGIDLYYEEQGTGDPLLLIMGITAPGAAWEKLFAHSATCFSHAARLLTFTPAPPAPE